MIFGQRQALTSYSVVYFTRMSFFGDKSPFPVLSSGGRVAILLSSVIIVWTSRVSRKLSDDMCIKSVRRVIAKL